MSINQSFKISLYVRTCGGFLMVCLWWSAFLSSSRWDLTVLDLLVWKSKEGSFTTLIGSSALQWTASRYVWDSYLAKCHLVLMQFHASFWPSQKCSIKTFIFMRVPIIREDFCRLRNKWRSSILPLVPSLSRLIDVFVTYRSESENQRGVWYVPPLHRDYYYSAMILSFALFSAASHLTNTLQIPLHPSGLLLLCTVIRQHHPTT